MKRSEAKAVLLESLRCCGCGCCCDSYQHQRLRIALMLFSGFFKWTRKEKAALDKI